MSDQKKIIGVGIIIFLVISSIIFLIINIDPSSRKVTKSDKIIPDNSNKYPSHTIIADTARTDSTMKGNTNLRRTTTE